jgi:hypothetical protein
LVGTWIVDRNPDDATDVPTLNVHTADGGTIDPLVGVGGAWQATGPRTAIITLVDVFEDGPGGYVVIRLSPISPIPAPD